MLGSLKWFSSDEEYYEILKYQYIHFKNSPLSFPAFSSPAVVRPVTGSAEAVVSLSSLCQAGSCSAWGTHLITIWSWRIYKEYILSYSLLCFPFQTPSSVLITEFRTVTFRHRYMPWLTSCATSDSSLMLAFPRVASTVQPGCSLIFVFHYSCDLSKATDSRLWVPVQSGCVQPCRNHRGDSCWSTKIKTAVCSFWFIKTWAGQEKGKRKSDSIFQIK